MSTARKSSLASRLTAGCVTLVVLVATIAAGFGWWWKFRASTRERAQRAPAAIQAPTTNPAPPDAPAPPPAAAAPTASGG